MNPLVSILVPVYNSEKWLKDTIESAVNQSWIKKEILIYDDGSDDTSYKIAKSFESENIKVFRSEQNRGQTATLNKLLKHAQGDYIQYLDSDDILDRKKIELQLDLLVKSGSDRSLATCNWARFYNNDLNTAVFANQYDHRNYENSVDWLLDSWNGRGTMPPTAWLIPRKVVDDTGPWNESLTLNNDNEYFSRMVINADSIFFCSEAKYYYRSGINSLSAKKDRKAYDSLFNVCDISTSNLLAYENSQRTKKASANLWQFFIYEVYPECQDLLLRAENKVNELGGSDLEPPFGNKVKVLCELLGWKASKRLHILYNNFFNLKKIKQ